MCISVYHSVKTQKYHEDNTSIILKYIPKKTSGTTVMQQQTIFTSIPCGNDLQYFKTSKEPIKATK